MIYPSNFCVKGSGIRFKGKTPAEMKQEVYDYFLERFKIKREDINFVNLTYDVKDYLEALEKYVEVNLKLQVLG